MERERRVADHTPETLSPSRPDIKLWLQPRAPAVSDG